jgi:hypothetical protein
MFAEAVQLAGRGNQATELTRLVVHGREGELVAGDRDRASPVLVAGFHCECGFGFLQAFPGLSRFNQPRTAEDHDGRADAFFVLDQLGLEQFELQADGTEFVASQECEILIRPTVRRRSEDGITDCVSIGVRVAHRRPL